MPTLQPTSSGVIAQVKADPAVRLRRPTFPSGSTAGATRLRHDPKAASKLHLSGTAYDGRPSKLMRTGPCSPASPLTRNNSFSSRVPESNLVVDVAVVDRYW